MLAYFIRYHYTPLFRCVGNFESETLIQRH